MSEGDSAAHRQDDGLDAASLRARLAELEAENASLARALVEAGTRDDAARRDNEAWLRLAQEAGGICSWQWDVATDALTWSDSCHGLHGMDPSLPPTFGAWASGIHPEDRPAVDQTLRGAMEDGADGWESEFRYIRFDDGATRWLVGRGRIIRHPATGAPVRLLGIGFDITERRTAEERQALLMRELDHRARNLLAVVQAALRLTPKDDPVQYARAVEGRIAALARAQAILAEARWAGSDLRRILEGELAPFRCTQRVALAGPPVSLPARSSQALAMALHEMATNAVKHGALSSPGGTVSVAWDVAVAGVPPLLELRWTEAGGPKVLPPRRKGFGSRVLQATIRDQLGGEIAMDWAEAGLRCALRVPVGRRGGGA